MVIAIDGPGGVGKSTVSRTVASVLDYPYLDTGSTYRAATLAVLRHGVDVADEAAILDVLDRHPIDYDERGILLDDVAVAPEVRAPEVTASVSEVSAHPSVRRRIVDLQRLWVDRHGGSAVVEGRDIGTVVFPDASVKVFLSARPEVRAQRRAGDDEARGASVDRIARELEVRDRADATRKTSPMLAAVDAVAIDTSDLSIDDVVASILELVAAVPRDESGSDAEQ